VADGFLKPAEFDPKQYRRRADDETDDDFVEMPEGVKKFLQSAGVLDAVKWDGKPAKAPAERPGPSKLDQLKVRHRFKP
jgi:hypothetical protein